jgi:large subunit ribosomal protein L15
MRLPKKGFNNFNKKDYQVVNIRDVIHLFDKKAFDSNVITKQMLLEFKLIKTLNAKVKLIMAQDVVKDCNFKVEVDSYSKSAQVFAG